MIETVVKAHGFDINKLDAFTARDNELSLAESEPSQLEREMSAVVVSATNRCFYCLTAHGAAVRQLSRNPILGEQLVMNWRVADVTPRQRSMRALAEKITQASYTIEETDRQTLREHGLADRDIWDVINVAAFFNMTNRVASATAMQPNEEYHGQAR